MVQDSKKAVSDKEQTLEIENIKRHLDMLDLRLDSIDSMITAVAERVLKQPVTLGLNCPKCGQEIEIAIIGTGKPV